MNDGLNLRGSRLRGVGVLALFGFVLLAGGFTSLAAGAPGPKTKQEKLGYTLGLDVGKNLRDRRVPMDPAAFIRGFIDGIERNRTALNPKEIDAIREEFEQEMARRRRQAREERMARFREAAATNLEAGEEFLEANRKEDGVVELDSGLQYQILKEGNGGRPTKDSTVRLHYRGLNSEGQVFESTLAEDRGPVEIPLSAALQGWREALLMMEEGAKWKIFVPARLAHGERGNPPMIGPNALTIYELELLEVK